MPKDYSITFGSIRRGNLSWAKGTSHFKYPEPKNTKDKPALITNLKNLVKAPARLARLGKCVMVAPSSVEKTVGQEAEAAGRRADAVDQALSISDSINRKLGILK